MAQSFTIVSEERSKRAIRSLVAEQLSLTQSVYWPGYWQILNFPEPTPVNNLSSRHVIISGSMIEPMGTLPIRGPGWISSLDTGMLPAGQWRRETPDGCEIWCVRVMGRPLARVDHVQIVCLNEGETHTVDSGENLFVAYGVCSTGTHNLEPYRYFKIGSQAKTITAQALCYLFVWPSIPDPFNIEWLVPPGG
jgi:hypothetical protein